MGVFTLQNSKCLTSGLSFPLLLPMHPGKHKGQVRWSFKIGRSAKHCRAQLSGGLRATGPSDSSDELGSHWYRLAAIAWSHWFSKGLLYALPTPNIHEGIWQSSGYLKGSIRRERLRAGRTRSQGTQRGEVIWVNSQQELVAERELEPEYPSCAHPLYTFLSNIFRR